MSIDPTYSRRMLLSHGVGAALTLPVTLRAAADAAPARVRETASAPLVVLDPGHGGRDSGAVGACGTCEKHISFAIAGELARTLRAVGRYRVALTRENDVFIPPEDRVAMARARGASLFVSIHAGAADDASVRGASVHTTASRTSDASARLQRHVLAALALQLALLDGPARHTELAALPEGGIPGVLVEAGVLSNPGDEAALRQASHRAIVAAAIGRAVDQYFTSQDHAVMAG